MFTSASHESAQLRYDVKLFIDVWICWLMGCANVFLSCERAEVDESSGRVNKRALSIKSVTNTHNGTSCATCTEVRRNTRRIAVHIELHSTGHDLRIRCGDPLHILNLRMWSKQILSSRPLGISTIVLCRLAWLKKKETCWNRQQQHRQDTFLNQHQESWELFAFAHETLHKFLSTKLRPEPNLWVHCGTCDVTINKKGK